MEDMDIRSSLKESIAKALGELGISVASEKIPLEHPADLKNGDYSTSIAIRALALEREPAKRKLEKYLPKDEVKDLSKIVALPSHNPHALAEKIVASLGTIEGVAKIEIAGAGFINFYLAPPVFAEAV